MIQLDRLKVVIFDFDDTLCVHSERHLHNDAVESDYNTQVFEDDLNVWSSCEPNEQLQGFMYLLQKSGVVLGLCSSTLSYKHMDLKQKWVKLNYGVDLENFSVGNRDGKLEILLVLAKSKKLKRDEILIVDDCYQTISECGEYGFQSCSPLEVVNFMNRRR